MQSNVVSVGLPPVALVFLRLDRPQVCQVYPPGDPLNLHFDPNQLPRDGSPQVGLPRGV